MDIRSSLLYSLYSTVMEHFISWEADSSDSRNLAWLVSEWSHIEVMVDSILRNHDISYVDISIHRTCNSGIDHMCHIEAVTEYLYTGSCIYFSDSALDYYDIRISYLSFEELHAGLIYRALRRHLCFEVVDFDFHSSYNSDLHLSFLSYSISLT